MFNHSRVLAHNCPRIWWSYLVLFIVATLLMSGCGAEQPRVYRVGILSGLESFSDAVDAFKAGMTEYGYIEGQTITYDVHLSNFDQEAYRRILQQFVNDKVDLIVAITTNVAAEAKALTAGTDIPIVFAPATTEGSNLVQSVSAPGGNITGMRLPGAHLSLKRLEMLRELLPQAKRIYLPYQSDFPTVPDQLELLRPAAEAAHVTLLEAPVTTREELEADLATRATADDPGMDAILFLGDSLAVTEDKFSVVGRFAAKHRVPMTGTWLTVDGYGAVLTVQVDNGAIGKQAASLADKILTGTSPGTIPVLTAESYLVINMQMAEELGITIPEGLLKQANEIIR